MKLSKFRYKLPPELIAQHPSANRDECRLMVVDRKTGTIEHKVFKDVIDYFDEKDVFVFNDTKVIPARLYGARGDARVEVTLYRPVDGVRWWSFVKNAKRLHPGDTVCFYTDDITPEESGYTASVIEKKEDDGVLIAFDCPPEQLASDLQKYGLMPLPPYIKRDKPAQGGIWDKYTDKENYQTIYARFDGAVAAPTAGLHFTDRVFRALEEKGVEKVFVTLHVGAGTFLPVKTADTKDHKMHTEYCEISPEACDAVNRAKAEGRRIIAVGTTSLRLLETAADEQGVLHPFAGDTGIFITPGYKFRAIDMLITNFHLPESTLLMLVSAFAGKEHIFHAYETAVNEKYRFFSFGDAMYLEGESHVHTD